MRAYETDTPPNPVNQTSNQGIIKDAEGQARAFLPFSDGPRSCIGQVLCSVVQEMSSLLRYLIADLPNYMMPECLVLAINMMSCAMNFILKLHRICDDCLPKKHPLFWPTAPQAPQSRLKPAKLAELGNAGVEGCNRCALF